MILRKLIDRVQYLYSKGVPSDDTRLSNRHIYNKLVSVRSRLLSEKARKNQGIRYEVLHCIELIDAPISECCCIPANICKTRRSKYRLPKLMLGMKSYLVNFVSTLDGTNINETTATTRHYISGNKYAKKDRFYYIQNDYLYIVGDEKLEIVMMEGLFEEPIPQYFKDCCPDGTSTICISPLDEEFPIDSELIEPLITLTIQEILELFAQMTEDISNNASDANAVNNE